MTDPLFTFTDDGVFASTATGEPVELVITSKPESFSPVIHRFDSTEFDFTVFSGGRQWWGELLTVLAVPADGWNAHPLLADHGLFDNHPQTGVTADAHP
ncbi:hypothetical protein ACFSSC_03300 [Corynebacterium mendelii]|uniref:Uncharacterized protein n=1 Tax=Corynebacterium mendelii TaxID=2765362 RepID=A0A939IX04_9CORY|nr:hypothetical protein [Corynebacterium mendelii]MBN9643568.1 hypothetical protein [Corynebacterium mendelii]